MNIHLAVVLWYFLEEIDKCFDIREYLNTCLYHLCDLLIIAVSCTSVEFLKWFTQPEHNISFSVDSGYLPVTTAANDMEAIKTSGLELSPKMERILSNAVQSVKNNTLYTPSAFAGGSKARKVLEYSLSDLASADRATVQERVAAGQPAADAEAEFLTDEYFDAWYGGICTALEKYAG